MTLREQITNLVYIRNPRKSEYIERDIEVILTYFGLGEMRYPTYESIGEELKAGSRERVRQIIKTKLIDKINATELPALVSIDEIFKSSEIHLVSNLITRLVEEDIIEENISIKGLLNLLKDFNICQNYSLYNFNLAKATRNDIEAGDDLLIIKDVKQKYLKKFFIELRTFPGQHGICNFDEICSHRKISEMDQDYLKRIIYQSANSWTTTDDDGSLWYMFEDRDNIIANSLEKLVNVTSNIDVNILSLIIYESINRRKLPFDSPPTIIIQKYLRHSHFIKIRGQQALLNINKSQLLIIEKEILRFYSRLNVEVISFVQLKNYLTERGYDNPTINKAAYHSPFIFVDRSKGRKNYKLILASAFSKGEITSTDIEVHYDYYKERLRGLYNQTDISIVIRRRKEQHILQEWLFRDKTHEKCAICGRLFKVSSLVTAHKKKRAICSESERTDPNIVMPLCLFGCDYLYEKEKVRILHGKVEVIIEDSMTQAEKDYLNKIKGLPVQEQWLKGSNDYFSD